MIEQEKKLFSAALGMNTNTYRHTHTHTHPVKSFLIERFLCVCVCVFFGVASIKNVQCDWGQLLCFCVILNLHTKAIIPIDGQAEPQKSLNFYENTQTHSKPKNALNTTNSMWSGSVRAVFGEFYGPMMAVYTIRSIDSNEDKNYLSPEQRNQQHNILYIIWEEEKHTKTHRA